MGSFGTGIKSIQSGTIVVSTTSNTATISAVVVANSFVQYGGETTTANDNGTNAYVELTDTTTVTATRDTATGTTTVSYTVVEYF